MQDQGRAMNTGTGKNVPHILIIEDDAAHRDLILRAFRDDPDKFRLSVATTIRSAREILDRDRPDLILSDWILPDGKGLDILPRTDGFVTIPLIIMTSFGDEHLAVEIMKSGAIDYVVKSATMFRDLPHIAMRALNDWENIRERKRAEAAVQDSQKRLADILNFLPDAVLAIDTGGKVIGWNHAIERMTGVMAADMLGKGEHEYSIPFYGVQRPLLIDLVMMDDAEIEKKYDYIQRDNGRITSEIFIPTLFGGKGAYLWGTASLLSDSAGNRTGAIEVIRDITDRKKSEALLIRREATLETLLNAPLDTIVLLDRQGIILRTNEEHARRLGGTIESLTGRCVFDLLPGDIADRRREYVDQVFRTGKHITFDDERSGRYLHTEIYPIFTPDHMTVENVAVFSRDITAQKKSELALQESERKYRYLIDNVRDIVWQTTPDLTFTYVSPAVETLTGYSPGDLIGTSLFAILTEPSAQVVQQRLRERMEDYSHGSRDLATIFETEIRKKDGVVLWIEISSNAVFGPDGTIAGFQGITRDVTDRKRAEEALTESEVRFHDLFSNMSAGVAIYEPTPDGTDFIIRDVNHAVETIEHVKKEEIVGKSVLQAFPGVVEFGLFTVFQRVARTGVAEAFPVTMYHDNRIAGWRENYVYKLPSGEVVALYEDVTERRQAEEALRESEQLLGEVFDNANDAIFLLERTPDGPGKYLLVNDKAFRMLGYAKEELMALSPRDIVPVDIAKKIMPDVIKKLLKDEHATFESAHRKKDGSIYPVEVSTHTFRYQGKDVDLSIVRDITERKLAEGKLRESEERYRSVIENAAEGITVAQDGMLQYANARLLGMTQVCPEEIVNRPFTDFIHPDDRAFVFERYQRRVAGENVPQHYDFRVVGTSGKLTWVQLSAVRIEWNGRPATLNFLMDITDRKEAEERLRESRQILEGILNTIPVRVFWKDKELTYLGCNTPFAQDAGFKKPDEVIGKDDYAMVWREQAGLYQADDRAVIESGNAKLMIEEPQTTPAGDTKYLLTSKMPLRDTRGDVIGVLGTYLDITDRKKAEEMIRESEERLLMAQEIGHIGGWEYNLRTNTIWGSAEGARIYGLPPVSGDFPLDQIEACIPERERVHQALADLIQCGKEYNLEFSINPADGSRQKEILSIARLEKDAQGNPIRVVGVIQDITSRKQAEEIRKAYELRLDSAMEIGRLAWWEMDLPGGEVRFDDRKATMLGYSPAQFAHYTDFTALLHPKDREPAMQAMKDHLEDRQSRYHIDYRLRTATGEYKWFRDVGGITRHHPDGSPATVTGIAIDITANKQAEETLHATETRYRALIQNSSDIIRILDRDGLIVYESESSERILGYPKDYLTGKNPLEYIHPDDLERVKKDFRDVIDRENSGTPTEFRIRKADGEYIWVDSIGTNLLDVTGVNGIVITTRPIQQRKMAEQALRESEARLATAMDIAGLVNWEFDTASGMFTFDDRFYSLYETTAEREGGYLMSSDTYLQEFVYPADRPAVLAAIGKILATTDPEYFGQVEHRITPRDGSIRTIIARFAPVMGPGGTVIRTFGANQDITDFKLMESEIRSLNTVLEQRVRDRTDALAKTNEALEEEIVQRQETEKKLQGSYDEKVLLLKEIHHRVKNNLQIIASLLNLQSRYIKDQSTLATLRESQNRVKAMALVHEKLYRSEDISHISLNDYIRFLGTGLFQSYDAKLRGIEFTLDIHDVNVDIDAAIPLGLVINELISNSLKYAFPDGRKGEISISVKKEAHILTVLYRDTGIGIPADLDWRDTESLGLRLVNTLVDQMNGTVELDRTAGTQFTMVLHEKEPRGPS
jgi:PAS domain S-box-containing protein